MQKLLAFSKLAALWAGAIMAATTSFARAAEPEFWRSDDRRLLEPGLVQTLVWRSFDASSYEPTYGVYRCSWSSACLGVESVPALVSVIPASGAQLTLRSGSVVLVNHSGLSFDVFARPPGTLALQAFASRNLSLSVANAVVVAVPPPSALAVPEATTSSMMLAGLGLIGLAARRRRQGRQSPLHT